MSSGPSGPATGGPGGGSVSGQTATYQNLSVTLLDTQDGIDSDIFEPDPGMRYYAVEVRYRNGSTSQRTYNPFDFELGLPDATRWGPTIGVREPSLNSGNLAPGEQVRGWVTFEIPLSSSPVRLYYSPRFDVTLAIPIP